MAPSLSHTIRAVLASLEARSPWARDRADLGDPRPLTSLINDVVRDENARDLLDSGAISELSTDSPDLGSKWQDWLTADLPAEAKWRSRVHRSSVSFGPKRIGLADLTTEIRSADRDRRDEALRVSGRGWRPLLQQLDWVTSVRSKDPDPAPLAGAATTAGGLIIPDATMVALFSQPDIIIDLADVPGAIAEESTPDDSKLTAAELFQIAELSIELGRSVGIKISSFSDWSYAISGAGADFSLKSKLGRDRAALPGPRFGTPISRISSRWDHEGHSARGVLAGQSAAGTWAEAAGLISPGNLRQLLAAPVRDREMLARWVALSFCGLLLESEWSHRAAGDLSELQSGCKTVVSEGAPQWWLELANLELSLSGRPGEIPSVYLCSEGVSRGLLRGAAEHLRLRAMFDEDWMLNPSTSVEAVADGQQISGADLLQWLRETCRL